MQIFRIFALVTLAGLLSVTYFAYGASVVSSKHDLSTGLNLGSTQPCVFCHTPHNASTTISAPLWNRSVGYVVFTPYTSTTMDTVPSNPPSGISLACLGCHDGVNASNDKHDLLNDPNTGVPPDTSSYPNCQRCHPDVYGLPPSTAIHTPGQDMSNDHPISIPYPIPAQDPQFVTPPDAQKGWGGPSQNDVKLYAGRVECSSCHNVHDPAVSPFLRKSNAASALCLTCHIK